MPSSMPSLPFEAPGATPIGLSHSMVEIDGWVYHFSNLELVDAHTADDRGHRNWWIGFLLVHCGLKPRTVAEAFGISARTAQRLAKLYREEGKEGIYRQRRPRSRVVVDPEMARQATALLAAGKSGRAAAAELGISASTFHENVRAGWIARPKATPSDATTGPAERDARDRQAPMGRAVPGRAAAAGLLGEAAPAFAEKAEMVDNGGVLAALPALVREGLPGTAARHLRLPKGYSGLVPLLLFLAFLFLTRTRTPERLRYQPPGEWGLLLGLDRCPEAKTLHRKIKALSAEEDAIGDWRRSLAAAWTARAEDATLAVDGHVTAYSGRKGNLPKKFVPRRKLCLRASSSCWINALGGAPLLCIHQQLDPGLVRSLETEAVPALEELGVLPRGAPDLTVAGCGAPALTLVFDREGWSPALFRRLARRGVATITWRKGGKGKDWAVGDFAEREVPMFGPGQASTITAPLAEKRVALQEGFEVREIRRRLADGRQVAIVSTHPSLATERIAGAMFSRWSQENFFKYMRDEFALDALTFHGLEPVAADATTVNPASRELEKRIRRAKSRLATLRSGIADTRRSLPALKNPKAAEKRLERREAREADLAAQLERLVARRAETPKTVAAGELPEGERLDALPRTERTFVNPIRMIAYRAETGMMPAIAASQGEKPNERALLRNLFTSPADILPETKAGILRVRIRGQASAVCEKRLAPLLRELDDTRTTYPGTGLRLVYETAATPQDGT